MRNKPEPAGCSAGKPLLGLQGENHVMVSHEGAELHQLTAKLRR